MLLLCFQQWPSKLTASPVPRYQEGGRRNWFLEQIATPPTPTLFEKNRSQTTFNFVHFGDSLSTQESALLNLYYVELGIKLSQRTYTKFFDESTALKDSSLEERNTACIELARNFITATNHYGRLGLEYVHFFPRNVRYLHIGINMGMMESAENPYSFRITVSRFQKLTVGFLGITYDEYNQEGSHVEGGTWLLASEIARTYTNEEYYKWKVGGFMKWSYRQRDLFEQEVNKNRIYEHMLFSFGPFTEWLIGSASIKLAANFRLLLDKSVELEKTMVKEDVRPRAGYPMEFRIPDINFQLSYIF